MLLKERMGGRGWRVAQILVAVVTLAVAGGCGGDDEGSSLDPGAIETSSITKQEFLQMADEICTLGNRWLIKQIGAYIKEAEAKDPDRGYAALFSDAAKNLVLARVDANISDMQSLGAPPGDETELEAFLVQMHQEAVALQEKPKVTQADLFGKSFDTAGELGRNYGLKACAY